MESLRCIFTQIAIIFKHDLRLSKCQSWCSVHYLLGMRDPSEFWHSLYHSLVAVADDFIPEKNYTVNNDLPAWLTPE